MRSSILAAAVGCISIGVAFAGDDRTDTTMTLPAGVSPKTLNDQQDVRKTLAEATNAAVTKGGFDDLIERLSSADRKRISEFANNREFVELDGRIEQIRKNWDQKYGQTFNLNNDKLLEGFVTIYEGEVTDAATARTHWPIAVRPTRDVPANTAETVDYLENGRNVAVVKVPASHDMPGLTVSMLHEAVDDWRIDV